MKRQGSSKTSKIVIVIASLIGLYFGMLLFLDFRYRAEARLTAITILTTRTSLGYIISLSKMRPHCSIMVVGDICMMWMSKPLRC